MADPLAPLTQAPGESKETPPKPGPSEPTAPEAPTAPPTPTPPSQPPPSGDGNSRTDARIKEALEAKTAAEAKAKEAEDKLAEHEKAQLGEKERAERERDEAKAEAEKATARATQLERAGWARDAAVSKGFIDPSDAVSLLDLNGDKLDTEAKVKTAVDKLAEEKKHLVGTKPAGGFGHAGGTVAPSAGEVIDPETGKPDEAMSQGRELLDHLTGGRR